MPNPTPRSGTLLAILLIAACSGSPTTSGNASVAVTMVTTGQGTRPATFQLTVDGSRTVAVAANGTTTIDGLTAGTHNFQLTAIPLNCTPDWYAPQPATVASKEDAAIAFHASCDVPLTGSVVYSRSGLQSQALFRVRSDGSGLLQLTPYVMSSADGSPAISPGGTRIVFLRTGFGLMIMNTDGSDPHQLTADPTRSFGAGPDWSPDGTQLALIMNHALVIMSADGRTLRTLWAMPANDPSQPIAEPRWSPSGEQIVYTYGKEVDVIDVKTGVIHNVRPPVNLSWGLHPAWSPDGTRIAYVAQNSLCIMNADGTGNTVIKDLGEGGSLGLAWFGGDGRILVSSVGSGAVYDLFAMTPDGTSSVNLTNTAGFSEWNAVWARP